MGQGGESSGRQGSKNALGTLSLAPIGLAQLFGAKTGSKAGGGLTIKGLGDFQLPQVFRPEDFASLGELAQPLPAFLPSGTIEDIGQQAGGVLGSVLPGVQQLAETGFQDEIAGLSKFLFENDIAPGLAESFGSQLGLGVNDSDLRAALVREGERTSREAANQAIGNRILGLQLGSQVPAAVAEQAGSVESLLQQAERQQQPSGQLLDLLLTLGGVNTQAGGVGSSAGTQRSKNLGIL